MTIATKIRTLCAAAVMALGVFAFAGPAAAVPLLQLDADCPTCTYDSTTTTEPKKESTVVMMDETFDLWGYLAPNTTDSTKLAPLLADTYYFSIALSPKTDMPGAFGSFTYDFGSGAVTVVVTNDMIFGNPPVETMQGKDGQDLPPHGIFETFFIELAFMVPTTEYDVYNTQDESHAPIACASSGLKDCMLGQMVSIDTTNLAAGFDLHFDLYNTQVHLDMFGDMIDVDAFAPFSHDVTTMRGPPLQPPPVPEPSALLLFSTGLFGLVFFVRRRRAA